MSLTYVDRILLLLAEGGYIVPMLIAKLKSTMPASVRHAAALALLNVSLRDRFKPEVVLAGGVEALVALLGSDDQEVRDHVNTRTVQRDGVNDSSILFPSLRLC